MTVPTLEERIDIWRYAYARTALLQTKGIAEVLLSIQKNIDRDHRIGLLTGLVVTYARPFTTAQVTKEKRVIPLHDVSIPTEHRELHDSYMEMRHQVFGHKDATGPTTTDGHLNVVHFIFEEEHFNLATVTPSFYEDARLTETTVLCDKLVPILYERLARLVGRHPLPVKERNCVYALNISDPDQPWMRKVPRPELQQ